jgi:RHO1 GDP-GTP exchange protein 1/2
VFIIVWSALGDLQNTTDQGKQAVYGTADGVYMSNLWEPNRDPVKVLALLDVTQVDVLEDYQLLIVLSGMPPY